MWKKLCEPSCLYHSQVYFFNFRSLSPSLHNRKTKKMIKYVNIINLQNRKHKSRSHHFQLYQPIQLYLTQWIFHLWILFTFLVIAGSESGEGSSFSTYSQTSTDEVLGTAEARGKNT